MARISNLKQFNDNKALTYKINKSNDESILLTEDDIKQMLHDVLGDKIDVLTDEAIKRMHSKLTERINFRMKSFETSLLTHIDDKINKITENIISKSTNRIIETEVNKRVDDKLNKIKNSI